LGDVTDGEETHMSTRNGETSESLLIFFMTNTMVADRLETAMDSVTTSDQVIVGALLCWKYGKGVKVTSKNYGMGY
jgi:hypothetical protein